MKLRWAVNLLLEGSDDCGNGLQNGNKRGDDGDNLDKRLEDASKL